MRLASVSLVAVVLLGGCSASDTGNNAAASRTASRAQAAPKNTKRIDASDLLEKLAAAGLETKDLGPASISVDHASRFPEKPRSTLALRVSDGAGNSESMTFVEFSSWKTAAAMDAKPVNGFAVRNWFVLGIVSNYFVEKITAAVS
jgi:hypothetical protein